MSSYCGSLAFSSIGIPSGRLGDGMPEGVRDGIAEDEAGRGGVYHFGAPRSPGRVSSLGSFGSFQRARMV